MPPVFQEIQQVLEQPRLHLLPSYWRLSLVYLFDDFEEEFSNAATTQFGSGWAWLVLDNGELKIIKTPNQESPISKGMIPLLTIDVWEHAYYLKYQNKRPDYVKNFFNVINWEKVNEYYMEAK